MKSSIWWPTPFSTMNTYNLAIAVVKWGVCGRLFSSLQAAVPEGCCKFDHSQSKVSLPIKTHNCLSE